MDLIVHPTNQINWVCYLLLSDDTSQTYIGSSNDADRRLHAHNTGRGAKRTKGQQWSHILIISGFDCKQSCLSFEAGWKRLAKRRTNTRLKKFNLKYEGDTVRKRLLDLLYFVRTFTFIGTKFILNADRKLKK